MISAISDALTAIEVWEFFPNTSTSILNSSDRVCDIFQKLRVKLLIPKLLMTYIKVQINHPKLHKIQTVKKTMSYR